MKKVIFATFALIGLCSMQAQTIHNDVFWDTADGTPLCIVRGAVSSSLLIPRLASLPIIGMVRTSARQSSIVRTLP